MRLIPLTEKSCYENFVVMEQSYGISNMKVAEVVYCSLFASF